jgi:hypothetical protein
VIKQLLASHHGSDQLLALVQRNGWELLESTDRARTWNPVGLTTAKAGKNPLIADQMDEAYGSPWGWLVRMADGQFWLRNEKPGAWGEWKPRLPAEPVGSKSMPAKRKNLQTAALKMGNALAFSDAAVFVSSSRGVLRCGGTGTCTQLEAFSASSMAAVLWVSADGRQIAVVQEGKLGISSDGGASASWRDLPVPVSNTLWIDEVSSGVQSQIVLGTAAGLFRSADGGTTWTEGKNGVPDGRMEAWLATPAYWLVSERSGGLYLSRDQGMNWSRVDEDAERGRFAGLVNLSDGVVLAGSQAEGLLRLAIAGK